MNRPNIFDFATSELSQDAFLCWLAQWADPAFAGDAAMHALGMSFLQMCFQVHGRPFPPRIDKIEILRQYKSIDVLLLVNQRYAVLIEDKVFTSEHDNQLARYKGVLQADFPTHEHLCIYLQTGNQSDISAINAEKYKVITRDKLLELLDAGVSTGCNSEILRSFRDYLSRLHEAYQSFGITLVDRWSAPAWEGFFTALQEWLGTGQWDYVPNRSGGFMGFWWHFIKLPCGGELYLQLEQKELCFKLAIYDREKAIQQRDYWHSMLMKRAEEMGISVRRPKRLAVGTWMTIGVLEPYLSFCEGSLDLEYTVAVLRSCEGLLDSLIAGVVN